MTAGSIAEILQDHAGRQPDAEALVGEGLRVTYEDFVEHVSSAAAGLEASGLIPGEVTAISLKDEIQHLVCAMALLWLGTPQVNLPTFETAVTKAALARKLGVTQIVAAEAEGWMAGLRVLQPPSAGVRNRTPPRRYGALDASVALYRNTSGSTSVPKSFGNTFERLAAAAKNHAADPTMKRLLRTSSVQHDASRVYRVVGLLAGNTCVFADQIEAGTLGGICARYEVSAMHIGTYKLASLVRSPLSARLRLPVDTHIVSGGSRAPGALRQRIKATLTDNLWISYSTSEVGPISMASPDEHDAYPEGVGRPLPGRVVEIVDPDGSPVQPGEIGQLRARTPNMAEAYVGSTTAANFRDGWFYPSDLLSWPEGGPLIFHGRADDMMIINSVNVFPSAIEDVLEGHPDVREAAAFGVPSRIHGEIPVAAVVLADSAGDCDPAHLLAHCRQRLGVRSPRKIVIVESIPRNFAGKPLRRELAAREISGQEARTPAV